MLTDKVGSAAVLTIQTWSEGGCRGNSQGTTHVDGGTVGCIEMKNAVSFLIEKTDDCDQVEVHYERESKCRKFGERRFYPGDGRCIDIPLDLKHHPSALITCTKASPDRAAKLDAAN